MSRYIDADKMIEDTDAMRAISDAITIDGIIKYINENATADVEEVRHGHWVQPNPLYNPFCSECKTYERSGEKKKYCSGCGARMDLTEVK